MNNMGMVVTSINKPTPEFLEILRMRSSKFESIIVIGDIKSELGWELDGIDYYDVHRQRGLPSGLSKLAPFNHYSRKNLGYLIQFEKELDWIYETDDDNYPLTSPFMDRHLDLQAEIYLKDSLWFNVYHPFLLSEELNSRKIWPRGMDLQSINIESPKEKIYKKLSCPIQQGLANGDPDVDAIYRLLYSTETKFAHREPIALDNDQWAPINSQSTWWEKEFFRLMYLPSTCSFRLTDIIRGFIALRILFSLNKTVSYHSPIVYQKRNEHNLLNDFNDEILLYTKSSKIVGTLRELIFEENETLKSKLRKCYLSLINLDIVSTEELNFLSAWDQDCDQLGVA
jgi:hypothetical protein